MLKTFGTTLTFHNTGELYKPKQEDIMSFMRIFLNVIEIYK